MFEIFEAESCTVLQLQMCCNLRGCVSEDKYTRMFVRAAHISTPEPRFLRNEIHLL